MDHSEAVRQMAVERYLLDELTPEFREDFEQHMFDCRECALELRTGTLFVEEAKAQLPELTASSSVQLSPASSHPAPKKPNRFFLWQPAFAVTAIAVLLAVIGYQDFATIPALRSEATEPRLLPWVTLHADTRDAAPMPVLAERNQGAVLLIDLPHNLTYTSYAFDLYDPHGKRFWTQTIAASNEGGTGNEALSLVIPGPGLQQGAYTLVISGISSHGGRTGIDRRVLDIHFDE